MFQRQICGCSNIVLLINICGESPALRVAANSKGVNTLYVSHYCFVLDDRKDLIFVRPTYTFDVTCQGTVPQAIVAFLESTDFENAIRLAISIGGDSDTLACITGGMASAYYKHIPQKIMDFVVDKLPVEYIEIMNKFDEHCVKDI